jgi:hypothetical protein
MTTKNILFATHEGSGVHYFELTNPPRRLGTFANMIEVNGHEYARGSAVYDNHFYIGGSDGDLAKLTLGGKYVWGGSEAGIDTAGLFEYGDQIYKIGTKLVAGLDSRPVIFNDTDGTPGPSITIPAGYTKIGFFPLNNELVIFMVAEDNSGAIFGKFDVDTGNMTSSVPAPITGIGDWYSVCVGMKDGVRYLTYGNTLYVLDNTLALYKSITTADFASLGVNVDFSAIEIVVKQSFAFHDNKVACVVNNATNTGMTVAVFDYSGASLTLEAEDTFPYPDSAESNGTNDRSEAICAGVGPYAYVVSFRNCVIGLTRTGNEFTSVFFSRGMGFRHLNALTVNAKVISGTVKDGSTPIVTSVYLLNQDSGKIVDRSQTASDGTYSLMGLGDDKFAVIAKAPNNSKNYKVSGQLIGV